MPLFLKVMNISGMKINAVNKIKVKTLEKLVCLCCLWLVLNVTLFFPLLI